MSAVVKFGAAAGVAIAGAGIGHFMMHDGAIWFQATSALAGIFAVNVAFRWMREEDGTTIENDADEVALMATSLGWSSLWTGIAIGTYAAWMQMGFAWALLLLLAYITITEDE